MLFRSVPFFLSSRTCLPSPLSLSISYLPTHLLLLRSPSPPAPVHPNGPSVYPINPLSLLSCKHTPPSFLPSPSLPSSLPRFLLPHSVLNFYLDSRWGLHADRLVVSKEQRGARSVPGLSLLQAADRALTSCHLTADLLVGDVAITQGRHYWACAVEPGSYLVKASKTNGRGGLWETFFGLVFCVPSAV